MGNCMEMCRVRRYEGGDEGVIMEKVETNKKGTDGEGSGLEKSGLRVKVVLTKDELEVLMLQLKNSNTSVKRRLEDVLEDIMKGRKEIGSSGQWKPSLDSITEIPEIPEAMDR